MKLNTLLLAFAIAGATVGAVFFSGGCAMARPYKAATSSAPPTKALVALTHAILDSDKRDAFDDYTSQIKDSLDSGTHEGLVGFSMRKRFLGDEVWTMTVWRDEDAMDAFVESDIHQQAIRRGMPAVAQFRFHQYWVVDSELPPAWDDALARIKQVPLMKGPAFRPKQYVAR